MRPAQGARRDAFLHKIGTRPLLMGIVNVTPDSFSDGGQFFNTSAALERAKRLAAEGADIIDVGGESTRPGATPLPVEDELTRIEPVLAAFDGALDVPVSIDTYKARVAARAVELGAILINDVWGLQKDPAMAGVVAQTGAAVVIMHNRAEKDASVDILADMRRFFERSLKLAGRRGNSKRSHHSRSRHRLCQDFTAEHRCDPAPAGHSRLWPADPDWRVAQGLSGQHKRWRRGLVDWHDRHQSCGGRQWRLTLSRA